MSLVVVLDKYFTQREKTSKQRETRTFTRIKLFNTFQSKSFLRHSIPNKISTSSDPHSIRCIFHFHETSTFSFFLYLFISQLSLGCLSSRRFFWCLTRHGIHCMHHALQFFPNGFVHESLSLYCTLVLECLGDHRNVDVLSVPRLVHDRHRVCFKLCLDLLFHRLHQVTCHLTLQRFTTTIF